MSLSKTEERTAAPFFDSRGVAKRVLEVLEDRPLAQRLRASARAYAERHLRMGDYLAEYEALIARLTGRVAEEVSGARAGEYAGGGPEG